MAEKRLNMRTNDEDGSTVFGTYRRQRGSSQFNSRSRHYSTTREGSVFSIANELPSYKSRIPSNSYKSNKRYDLTVNGNQNEMTNSFSLLDLPPAETNGSSIYD